MDWSFTDNHDGQYFMGYDLSLLKMDEFYMRINESLFNDTIYLYTLNTECEGCPFMNKPLHNDTAFKTNTKFRIAKDLRKYYSQEDTNNVICDIQFNFGQFGVYKLRKDEWGCAVVTLKEPVNIYNPLLSVTLLYIVLCSLLVMLQFLWTRCGQHYWNKFFDVKEEMKKKEEHGPNIKSFNVVRGTGVILLVFSTYGSGGYEWLGHAKWNGLYAADVVFAFFVWILGAHIPIWLYSNFRTGITNRVLIRDSFIRASKFFCMGVLVQSGTDLKYLRILGILQRIGISYCVTNIICIFTLERSLEINPKSHMKPIQGIKKVWKGWLIVLVLALIHALTIFFVPSPGCPRGYMGPGGLHMNRSHVNCVGGITGYVDRLVLGDHIDQKPIFYGTYESKPFDSEGILGILNVVCQVFLGVQAGIITLVYPTHSQRLKQFVMWAITTGVLGAALCGCSKDHGIIPINKNLYSLSFVLVTSSIAFSALCISYVLVDMKRWWSGKPFLFAGMNVVFVFVGHQLTQQHFPIRWYPHDSQNEPRRTHFIALMSDSWGAFMWTLISYYLYKINYFFTL